MPEVLLAPGDEILILFAFDVAKVKVRPLCPYSIAPSVPEASENLKELAPVLKSVIPVSLLVDVFPIIISSALPLVLVVEPPVATCKRPDESMRTFSVAAAPPEFV